MTETREETLSREARERGIVCKPLEISISRVFDKIQYIGPCTEDCPYRINEPGLIRCNGGCIRDSI